MTNTQLVPIFDGHNDILLKLIEECADNAVEAFFQPRKGQHIDLLSAQKGGFAGGLFAMFIPPEDGRSFRKTPSQEFARDYTMNMITLLRDIAAASDGKVEICRSVGDIRKAMAAGIMAPVLHIEGAEAILPDLSNLEAFYNDGLRSIGPVWSRSNAFAHGVPFKFPASPDTGPGLTNEGMKLVKACNEMGIAVDLSHLNEKGFWDVARISTKPLIASHSNVHTLCPTTRNLTDGQLKAIKDSNGIAGLNFAVSFLRKDGAKDVNVPLSVLVEHVDYMVDIMGIDHVGIGSDYDGAPPPSDLDSTAKLPALTNALREAGYDDDALNKICHGNWLRVLEDTWGA
ncbi:dipeptidase [Maritalea sp.]|jgi:membrane dipeptidase|uniref:dipeptidase n=1 Tax=Maritalea sp. TaxID=2003361 RepID=UPI0039E249F4